MPKVKKTGKWIKKRHSVVKQILRAVLPVYMRIAYGFRPEKYDKQRDEPYLILYNHQTPFDQFFIGASFKETVYYVASEDIFSNGFVSNLIRFLVAPIPIKKSTNDVRAVLNCLKVKKEGGTIAIAPEGNRTYSGRTGHMLETIAPLAKKLGMPIALYRIEGGYGAEPRWSNVIRRGKMRAYVSEVIYPEEYAALSDAELLSRIENGLYVDECQNGGEYRHSRLAEYLERVIYVCPEHGLSEFESRKDTFRCKLCGKAVRYNPDKTFSGIDSDFRFKTVGEWYSYQNAFVNSLMLLDSDNEPLYRDTVNVFRVIPYKNKKRLSRNSKFLLHPRGVTIDLGEGERYLGFDEISAVSVLGRNKLNIYSGGSIYQFKGDKRFCALKYLNFYHRFRNLVKGDNSNVFLGL